MNLLAAFLAVRVFYYVPADDAWQSLTANIKRISVVAPQVFSVDAAGVVRGAVESRVRELASRHGVALMPLLMNQNFDVQIARAIFASESLRRKVITDAVRLCRESGAWGLQLDFEGLAPHDRAAYMTFVAKAAAAFHAAGLGFSVAIPTPLFTGSLPSQHYAAVFGGFPVTTLFYDPAELARHVDLITLMTYDQYGRGTAPGPVGGLPWVEQNARFLLQTMPAHQLSLGIGLYGRRWCNQDVFDLPHRDAIALAKSMDAKLQWHSWQRSHWFSFPARGCENVVWFEDRRSLREKLRLVRTYRLMGFSAWRLGQEDPEVWKEVRGRPRAIIPARFPRQAPPAGADNAAARIRP